eukprot:5504964-Amphidinium_carterae.9
MREREDWQGLVNICSAHKIHASATKTWDMHPFPAVVSGIIHAGLLFRNPSALGLFKEALRQELQRRPLKMYVHTEPSAKTRAFRQQCLRLFGPRHSEKPRRAALLDVIGEHLLNGNWQASALEHYCSGSLCCTSEAHCREKILTYVPKLLKTCPPSIFAKNNWTEWHRGTQTCGLLESMHGLWSTSFTLAFGKLPATNEREDAEQDGSAKDPPRLLEGWKGGGDDPTADEFERRRQEEMEHQKQALAFFTREDWFDDVLILRQALHPELELMRHVLRTGSFSYERLQQKSLVFPSVSVGSDKNKCHLKCVPLQNST